jgi:hypothetical protein
MASRFRSAALKLVFLCLVAPVLAAPRPFETTSSVAALASASMKSNVVDAAGKVKAAVRWLIGDEVAETTSRIASGSFQCDFSNGVDSQRWMFADGYVLGNVLRFEAVCFVLVVLVLTCFCLSLSFFSFI